MLPGLLQRCFRFAAAVVVAATLSSCGDDSAATAGSSSTPHATLVTSNGRTGVSVTEAMVNKPVSGQPNAGVYAVVTNNTDHDITIVGATSSVSDDVQLHLTVAGDDGTMSMQQVDSIDVARGDRYAFEHGGPHIMLIGVDAENFPDDQIDVALQLADGTEVPFQVGVRTLETSTVEALDQESIPTQSAVHG